MNVLAFTYPLEYGFTYRMEAQRYYNRKNIDILQSFMFEYFLFQRRKVNKQEFYVTMQMIARDTGLGRRVVTSTVNYLIKNNLIQLKESPSKHNRKYFSIDLETLLDKVEFLYDFSGLTDPICLKHAIKSMEIYLKYLLSDRGMSEREMKERLKNA